MCDKELEGCGGGGDAALKDMAFLPLQASMLKHSFRGGDKNKRTDLQMKDCLHSAQAFFPPFLQTHHHTHKKKKKKRKGLAVLLYSLAKGRETLCSAYFLPKTFTACQWKEKPSSLIPLWTENMIILTHGFLIPQALQMPPVYSILFAHLLHN